MKTFQPNRQQVGEAGVHYVISELALRGLIALPTSRNSKGPDIIVCNPEGTRFAAIQVKTRRGQDKFWNVSDQGLTWGGPDCYYVFVRIVGKTFEAFLERAEEVKIVAKADIEGIIKRGKKSWGPSWGFIRDEERKNRTQRQWEEFDLQIDETERQGGTMSVLNDPALIAKGDSR